MESYQTWLGERPELSVLRMLGLFDRPADEKAIGALLKAPPIRGLTESLIDSSPTERRTLAPQLPERFREMEPLFSAVICSQEMEIVQKEIFSPVVPVVTSEDVPQK